MGAYFVLYPKARVLTIVPLIIFFTFWWLPAWIVLGYWFLLQFLSGTATSIAYTSQSGGGVAFWAHVGGFVTGIILIKVFRERPQRNRYGTW
jgi:rhomboid family protein